MICRRAFLAALGAATGLSMAIAYADDLPRIGQAPPFVLTAQDGHRLSMQELRGQVVVVTFIFTACADACPLLTARLAAVRKRLGADFGRQVSFLSVSVDPTHDTSEVLKQYARDHGAVAPGWLFLTGRQAEIREVAKGYGVVLRETAGGGVDHTFLTSLVDRSGTLRVQYLGTQFDPDEMLKDIQSLVREGS
jgi:protein SCO1